MIRKIKDRKKIVIRHLHPDAKYNSELIQKFIRYVMEHGKLKLATRLVYSFLENISLKYPEIEVKSLFEERIIGALIYEYETRKKIFGGSGYHIPQIVNIRRQFITEMKIFYNDAKSNQRTNKINIVTSLTNEAESIIKGFGCISLRTLSETKKRVAANKALEKKSYSKK